MRWDGRKVTITAVPKVDSILNQVYLMSYKRFLAVAARNHVLDLNFSRHMDPIYRVKHTITPDCYEVIW